MVLFCYNNKDTYYCYFVIEDLILIPFTCIANNRIFSYLKPFWLHLSFQTLMWFGIISKYDSFSKYCDSGSPNVRAKYNKFIQSVTIEKLTTCQFPKMSTASFEKSLFPTGTEKILKFLIESTKVLIFAMNKTEIIIQY